MDPKRLAQYHAVAERTAGACWANRSKRRISRAAFGVWSRSTAMLDSFWAGVLRGRARDGTLGREATTVLGYGAGWGGTGGGPHKRVRDSAERIFTRARVTTIEEFNTSKTCHVCGDVLQGVVEREKNFKKGAPAGAVDRGLKHCARRTCSSFLDRDVNAALNMLKVLLARLRGEERPLHLRRDSVQSLVCVDRPSFHMTALRDVQYAARDPKVHKVGKKSGSLPGISNFPHRF
jgi:hypothetical protein